LGLALDALASLEKGKDRHDSRRDSGWGLDFTAASSDAGLENGKIESSVEVQTLDIL
jgi:hypothetical protein